MSWNPVDSGILTSTVLKEGPDVFSVWMLIVASMDKFHETRLTPAAAASLLRIEDERTMRAFEVLAAPDLTSRNKEHEGRRILPGPDGAWLVVSGEKYAALASRAMAATRQRRYLERKAARERCAAPECEQKAVPGAATCSEHAFRDGEPAE